MRIFAYRCERARHWLCRTICGDDRQVPSVSSPPLPHIQENLEFAICDSDDVVPYSSSEFRIQTIRRARPVQAGRL